jgi:hypothetical protein
VSERADLDRLRDCCGGLRRPGERRVDVRGVNDVKAAEVFLASAKGPSVVSTLSLSSDARTTVAVSASGNAAPNTQVPDDFSSCSRTPTRSMNCRISSSLIGLPTSPSTLWTDSK